MFFGEFSLVGLRAGAPLTMPGHSWGSGSDRLLWVDATSGRHSWAGSRRVPRAEHEERNASLPVKPAVVSSWAQLSNRADLAAAFGWDATRTSRSDDEALILAAFRHWGRDCVTKMEGNYAFVIWDPSTRSIFAARDAVGIRPLYYATSPGRFSWSSAASLLHTVDWVDTSVRQEWLVQYVPRRSMDWQRTALSGVFKLPPGHWLVADLDTVRVHRYHQFRDDAPWEDTRDPRWLSDYSDALTEAVRAHIDVAGPIGAETSGGLDSSTLVGMIAKLHPETADTMHTFGFVRDDLETEYILETSKMWRIAFNHILCPVPGASMEQARRGWEAVGYPVEHGSAISHVPFYDLARTFGVRTLHSGHGGDEIVTNSGGKALVELINHGRWRQALSDLRGPAALRPLRLARVWQQRRLGEVSRLTDPMMQRLKWSLLRRDVYEAAGIEQRTLEAARYDAPYDTVNGFILGDRVGPHLSTRTSECSIVAATYGIEYQWPLLDRRLVQQYLSTPAVWKYGEGYGRYLHRRAVAGIVPDKVAWKRDKSMQSPGSDTQRPDLPSTPYALPNVGDLHPQLEAIVDRDRVHLLTRSGSDAQARVVRNQLRRILVLNTWLNERGG